MHININKVRWLIRTSGAWMVAAVMMATVLITAIPRTAHADSTNNRAAAFRAAANEFDVPEQLLLAISYYQTRWENHRDAPSVSGGYGLMHLTTEFAAADQRGDPARPLPPQRTPHKRTLDEAAHLTAISPQTIKTDETQNIRAGAALLAQYARDLNNNKQPDEPEKWYTAVARLGGAADQQSAEEFADGVYELMRQGISATTTDGQNLHLPARPINPDKGTLSKLGLPTKKQHDTGTECPSGVTCKYVPARFAQNNPTDPYDYGNYDQANRPQDMKVEYIVIHDTEGSYQSAISWFQDPRSYTSAHYVIRSSDGEITQMVKTRDVAWHAGNWYMNTHSIGIEHEGWAAAGATWYTEAMYRSSAKLVRYLAEKYNVPLDRQHIVGHQQYMPIRPNQIPSAHADPGPFWDWEHYMRLLHAPIHPTAPPHSDVVTIAPAFARNNQTVTNCWNDVCTSPTTQPANFVYLRTAPDASAPLVSDPGMHPDGSPSTTDIQDVSARAVHGQQFVVAERRGNWTAVWFGGQKGWLYNPWGHNKATVPSRAATIRPKPGLATIPVYGRPVPEPPAYPATITPLAPQPLPYSIAADQRYTVVRTNLPNDYYHMWTFDKSGPGDGTVVIGQEKYIPITFNHRQAFVKASDVVFD